MESKAIDQAGGDAIRSKYLTFRLGSCEYGIVIQNVREIIAMHEITPLPQLPDYVQGVINLRGKIIPVVDLRLRLSLEAQAPTRTACIVVTEIPSDDDSGMELIGCTVDGVSDVRDIDPEAVQPVPRTDSWSAQEHVTGLVQFDTGVVALLSITNLLGKIFHSDQRASIDPGAVEV